MVRNKRDPGLWPGLALLAAGLLLAAFLDWPLNAALYNPENPFAVWMEAFGWYPALLGPALLVLLAPGVLAQRGRRFELLNPVAAGVYCLMALALFYASHSYLLRRGWVAGWFDEGSLVWAVFAVLLFAALPLALRRLKEAPRLRLWFFARWATVLTISELMGVQLVKLVWRRTRFDDILAGGLDPASLFTPWYRPFGNGGSSFPSAHTANAACILALVLLCDLFAGWARRRGLVLTLCWGFTAAMGLARMVVGRHYLSDVLAAAAITALLLFCIRRCKLYRAGLSLLAAQEGRAPKRPRRGGT